MSNKNNTREGIHSGLSQSKQDSKWSDMLNFRSSDNRTFVVPHRLALHQFDAGLHTILHGVGDLNYAIGSKKSFVFRAHDGTEFRPLWQARIERVVTKKDQSENLQVRGSYLGTVPINIRLTVLNGLLVLDKDIPPVIDPEDLPDVPTAYHLHLSVTKGSSPLPAPEITIYQGTLLIGQYIGNANGLFSILLPINSYSVVVESYGEQPIQEFFEITSADVPLAVNFSAYFGLQISVRYSDEQGPVPGGHRCDSAMYRLLGNGELIGIVNLNNATAPADLGAGDRRVDFTITAEQAEMLLAAGSPDEIELSLVCDPTLPGFDTIAWSGTCHSSLAWVVVKDNQNVELYNGAPVGYFVTIPF